MPRWLKGAVLPIALVLLWRSVRARRPDRRGEHVKPECDRAPRGLGTVVDGSLLKATRETFLGAALAGLALGAALGIVCGIAFGLWRLLAALMRLSTEALRLIPSVALIPLALRWISATAFAWRSRCRLRVVLAAAHYHRERGAAASSRA